MHPIILGHLTVLDLPPPEVVSVAAEVGFSHVGLRLLATRPGAKAYPLASDEGLMNDTLSRLRDTGVSVFDVDVLKLGPSTDLDDVRRLAETAERLEAKSVLVTAGHLERPAFVDLLGQVCEVFRPHGLVADLEFMKFTPTVPDLDTARSIVEDLGLGNLGVLIDSIHWDRLGADAEAVAALPREMLHYIHLTDARPERPTTMDGLREDTRLHRLFPGDGAIDLVSLIRALPSGLPLCVEVSNQELNRTLAPRDRARRAMKSVTDLLNRAGRTAAKSERRTRA